MQAMVHGHKPPKLNPTIYLYNANFSGSIPDSWSGMSSMQTLQMFVNSLTGTLPAAFGNFAQLISLNVAFNNFTGDVPVLASSKLRAVQSIVLQDNPHLSGEISLSWNNIWTFGAVCNICRTKICGPRLSMMTFGYGCLPQSALSLLAGPVTISTIAKLSAASTFVDNVSCPSSVTPRSLTTSRSDIYVVPHDSAIPIVPVVSASVVLSVSTLAQMLVPVASSGALHALQAALVVQHLQAACAAGLSTGPITDNTGADSCCDASTSPSQLVLESVDSSYPQFAGAVVGNTIIVVAYGCVRTLLRLGLRSASSSHFFCSHLMELVDTTNVATIWPVFTFLLSPTMSVCVALLSLYSNAVSLATGVVGILLAGAPWALSAWGVYKHVKVQATHPPRRRKGVSCKVRIRRALLDPSEQLYFKKKTHGTVALRSYGPVFAAFRAQRIWYFNVELTFSVLAGILVGQAYALSSPCDVTILGWLLVVSNVMECICVLFFRPYSTLIDTITVLVVNTLSGASQIVSLMSTTGEGSAVSTALGLIASVFQLVVAIGLGLDGVGRFFEGGGLYRGVWIEDQTTQAQKVTNLSNMEVRNDTPMVHERSNHYLMQPPCDEKDIQKRQNRVVDAAALAHLSTIIATICDVQYALNA